MAIIENFLIPLIEIIVIGGIIAFIVIVVFRALLIKWNRSWMFVMKYDVMKSAVDPIKSAWIFEALQNKLTYAQIHQKLLLAGFKKEDIREMLFLSNRISNELNMNELKGGQNGRKQFKRSDRKNEGTKLPTISKY